MVGTVNGLTEQDVHREHGYVQMSDGARLAYVVWRPRREGRYPVLFQYAAYEDGALTFAMAKEYLEAGYALIGANIRGSGCSEGENFIPFSSNEGPDGAQIVEWAGEQPWSTGNVGMIGNSYSAGVQWLVGAERPPHLKALSIAGSSLSMYRDWLMVGGMFHQYAIGQWGLVDQECSARIGAERRIKEWGDKECELTLARYKPNGLYDQARQHPLQDDWWERTGVSRERAAPLITVPTMLIAGLQDEYSNPASAGRAFAHLLPKVAHKKLIYINGGHSAVEQAPVVNERIRWMDHWVKGVDNGVDKEAPVTVFWETRLPCAEFSRDYNISREQFSRAVPGWTTTYADWPVPNLQRTTFYLTGDAKLSPTQPVARPDQGVRNYLYPTGTELVGSNTQFGLTPVSSGTLHYRTDPMTEDTALLGNPEIVLNFSSEQTDTDFMVTVKDIDPEGNTLYLTRGFLRASMREIDSARSWSDEINQSYRKVEMLEPGKIYEARFSLWTIGHVVREGHRLELSILAPSEIPSPLLGAAPVGAPSVNKVYHSPQFPSRLVLPIVPGEKAQAPTPACGTLWNQPCRKPPSLPEGWNSGGFVRSASPK
ncbi:MULTISPECIES: CocE/NonD family hydrolase [unclassified Mesorhizobium]|uniref:CocE/NonD family hydrolase n=1 Tax=unclassified Mesorhizobium TaxID=325217 RepID=UPI000FD5B35A|nr:MULTISPECIES: CocE/NonD family hydrolase [unclassified Mesorhizobium]RUV06016.1 CocE/NonD family hydrolase [Mesorhizobium sp. M1A.F.Ca.IN.020.03.2.1]RUW21427.1 CocE/NonD family hydrolase [Mesorhizobium sp. M4B.F.Ca.ET.013.02.1.1]RWG87128.1 MAG: CocE/NonD family hydrolase [Mesorhizobium sp.]RWK18234.1 MAG: CocE/NonD family hydrolase [Mesorhizobium sp.]TGV18449.1 CocE/NonD family hydrolase [Mesorhizobium sp. M4B.F.Ca.ET.143.01.1.1]